jgi:hypothetical protein
MVESNSGKEFSDHLGFKNELEILQSLDKPKQGKINKFDKSKL